MRHRRRKKKSPGGNVVVEWRRCGDPRCARLVKVPADPRGRACPKCGTPLTMARDI